VLNIILKWSVATSLAFAISLAAASASARTVTGRITAYTAISLSVLDKEVITLRLSDRTVFTKMVTQKPWQEDTRLDKRALAVGRYVAVHVRKDDPLAAAWVQIATDMRPVTFPTGDMTRLTEPPRPSARASDASPADVLSKQELLALVASAKTAEDHLRLAKHFSEKAARYEADAEDHAAMAKAYRTRPTASESKRPGAPDTSAHCDRLAEFARKSAQAAREIASEHRAMAEAAK
jgi:hypothetical protein